jgi:hypothetical protein
MIFDQFEKSIGMANIDCPIKKGTYKIRDWKIDDNIVPEPLKAKGEYIVTLNTTAVPSTMDKMVVFFSFTLTGILK